MLSRVRCLITWAIILPNYFGVVLVESFFFFFFSLRSVLPGVGGKRPKKKQSARKWRNFAPIPGGAVKRKKRRISCHHWNLMLVQIVPGLGEGLLIVVHHRFQRLCPLCRTDTSVCSLKNHNPPQNFDSKVLNNEYQHVELGFYFYFCYCYFFPPHGRVDFRHPPADG